jgi:hypothetical protein
MGTGALVLRRCSPRPSCAPRSVSPARGRDVVVTGFTVSRSRHDQLRSIVATLHGDPCASSPRALAAGDFWDWFVGLFGSGTVTVSGASYSFPGVRIALWGGGIMTFLAGLWARHSVPKCGMTRSCMRSGAMRVGAGAWGGEIVAGQPPDGGGMSSTTSSCATGGT